MTTAPPNTYTIVMPPDWARIPLRSGTEPVVRRIVRRTFSPYPRDEVTVYRREFEQRLMRQIRRAREACGLDLFMPSGPMHGIPVAASVLVSEVAPHAAESAVDPEATAARLATAEDGERVPVDGALAVRTARLVPADPAGGSEFAARRVDYTVPVPGDPGRWLCLAFSTLCSDEPDRDISALLVELFDAMMTTFRWDHR